VALAPAGGWAPGDPALRQTLGHFRTMQDLLRWLVPHADAIVSTPEGRRRATELIAVNFDHIPPGLVAHQMAGIVACRALDAYVELARRDGWSLEAERIECPVRMVWGTEDKLLPWPSSAARYREEWLPHADWVVLDGVGHCPQLDVPLETTELILGFTARAAP
jgi:pimeloyl-ACP methyl ester carboxylesterase